MPAPRKQPARKTPPVQSASRATAVALAQCGDNQPAAVARLADCTGGVLRAGCFRGAGTGCGGLSAHVHGQKGPRNRCQRLESSQRAKHHQCNQRAGQLLLADCRRTEPEQQQLPGSLIALVVFCALAAFEALAPVAGAFLPMSQVINAAQRVNDIIDQSPAITFPADSDARPGL